MSIFNKEFDLVKFTNKIRKTIPERNNKIQLVDELFNDEIDHYASISNRVDGKTFNYISFFILFAYETGVNFTLLARHYSLRQVFANQLMEIFQKNVLFKMEDLNFKRYDDYIQIIYKEKIVGIISDLNNATDLKYSSQVLKNFPIMIYDEFLAIESDYLPDEYERLHLIYTSIDREIEIPYIKFPKLFYLGNAVNFSSPVLNGFDIFDKLEKQELNTMRQYDNILLEMIYNEEVNKTKNMRAFKSIDDPMNTGRFKANKHLIATDSQKTAIKMNPQIYYIKLDYNYIKVTYNTINYDVMMAIVPKPISYEFCTETKDMMKNVIFLKESFYDEKHYMKYVREVFLFENVYSKEFILNNVNLSSLKIYKTLSWYESYFNKKDEIIIKEIFFEENRMDRTKKMLAKRFEGGTA